MNKQLCFVRSIMALCIFSSLLASPAWGLDPVLTDLWGTAIRGYDPVAYFNQGKAIEGLKTHTYDWGDAEWRFATQQNRDAFAQAPEKYSPQYGGYCAWAVSQGYTASIDPHAWSVYEGKLYLNYNLEVRKTWSKDIPGNVKKADKNWPKLLAE